MPDSADAELADAELFAAAAAWLRQDPDAETREELRGIVAAAASANAEALADLHDRFDSRLQFGTAGLRGRTEAGPNRMNRVVVAQAAAGFAAFLLLRAGRDTPTVVIGYDGRRNSHVFAVDTAEIMQGAGVNVIMLPRLLPTPVLAFAVRHLKASAGVMVTASHNPAADNGYKVYLGDDDNGSQIVAPDDGLIAEQIVRVATDRRVDELLRSTDYAIAPEEVIDEYIRRTASVSAGPTLPLRYVYTAMHGVGWESAERVFAAAGFAAPIAVLAQRDPDAAFPTVAFPNPEEPGALDLAFATALEHDAELVVANDPDADRLAIGIPTVTGGWERLSGNEVGAFLGWRAAERLFAIGPEGSLAASIVSTPALAEIARQYDLDYADTLTGFKWISRSPGLAYGFEEALGYLVDPSKVRDKDGISAAVDFIALVAELKAQGKTVLDHRADFARKFGAYASAQISIRTAEVRDIPRIMAMLRKNPPQEIGSLPVRQVDDFSNGFGDLPAGDILRIWMENGARVIVRPSGTEPKIKVYIDASSLDGSAEERQRAAQAIVDELVEGVQPLVA